MSIYLGVKLLHIISATVLFGTGLGTAFFMLKAHRSGNLEAIRITTGHVVTADWIFTSPAVVIQLVTGLWLTHELGIPYGSAWFVGVMSLFVLVGACWIPVVWIQIKLRDIGEDDDGTGAADERRRLMAVWAGLGIPAFLSVLALFALMVFKPGIGWLILP